MSKKPNLTWIDEADKAVSTETKTLTQTTVEIGKKTIDTSISFTKTWSGILGIAFLFLSAIFVLIFAGSYQAFFLAMSKNLFVSVAVFVLGALLTTSFFSKLFFLIIPEGAVTKVAAMLHVPLEVAIVLVLIVIMALFAAMSALVFFVLGFMFLGVGALIKLIFKKTSGLDVGIGVLCILMSVPAFITFHIIGILFGIVMLIIGLAYLVPIKPNQK